MDEATVRRRRGGLVSEVVSIAIVPGHDATAATDEDSDVEEEPTASGLRLPRVLMRGEASVSHRRMDETGARARPVLGEEEEEVSDEEEDTQEEEEEVVNLGPEDWEGEEPNPPLLGINIPAYRHPVFTYAEESQLIACTNALDWFEVFSSKEWLEDQLKQSREYAVSVGRQGQLPLLPADNIR